MTRNQKQLVTLDAANRTGDSPRILFGLTEHELAEAIAADEPRWRGRQLAEALYRQRVTGISEITTLPISLRENLTREGWQVGRPQIVQTFRSIDGTERYLVQCTGAEAETGAPSDRSTVAGVVETGAPSDRSTLPRVT